MRIVSTPYAKRVGLIPMSIGLALGWVFIVLWLAVARYVWASCPPWSLLIAASSLAFAVVLGLMTFNLVGQAYRKYEFEIGEDDAVLTIEDTRTHARWTKAILLRDIKYAEYYPYSDSACIILHTPCFSMEVPLWSMQRQGKDVLDFLDGRGIKVVNVQTDDCFPD